MSRVTATLSDHLAKAAGRWTKDTAAQLRELLEIENARAGAEIYDPIKVGASSIDASCTIIRFNMSDEHRSVHIKVFSDGTLVCILHIHQGIDSISTDLLIEPQCELTPEQAATQLLWEIKDHGKE